MPSLRGAGGDRFSKKPVLAIQRRRPVRRERRLVLAQSQLVERLCAGCCTWRAALCSPDMIAAPGMSLEFADR
jgi:hypothetical protein